MCKGAIRSVRNGASSLTLLHANCRSDSLVKSNPVVRSMDDPATSPYRFATFATRSGEYTSVISTPRIVAAMILRSTNSMLSRSCICASKSSSGSTVISAVAASVSKDTVRLLSNRPNFSSSSNSAFAGADRFGAGDSLDALMALSKLALSSSSSLRLSALASLVGFL